jgi:hypothetical protein
MSAAQSQHLLRDKRKTKNTYLEISESVSSALDGHGTLTSPHSHLFPVPARGLGAHMKALFLPNPKGYNWTAPTASCFTQDFQTFPPWSTFRATHSAASSAEVKNARSYTSAPPTCLHGVMHHVNHWIYRARIPLQKLTVAQLVKILAELYGIPRVITVFTNCTSLVPILSQIKPIHTLLKSHFNIKLPYTHRSSK